MFLRLRSIVTPGLSSVLTPLASAACDSLSRMALLIASRATVMTWFADMGPEAERFEFEYCWNFSGIGGGGGGGGMLEMDVCSLRSPWAGFDGKPREFVD